MAQISRIILMPPCLLVSEAESRIGVVWWVWSSSLAVSSEQVQEEGGKVVNNNI